MRIYTNREILAYAVYAYVKKQRTFIKKSEPNSNYSMVVDALKLSKEINPKYYTIADRIIEFFSQTSIQQILKGDVNEIDSNINKLFDKDSETNVGLISYVPQKYIQMKQQEKLSEVSQHVGKIGDKVKLKIFVDNVRYSWQHNCCKVYAMANGNMIFFFTNLSIEPKKEYSIKGKVKSHWEMNEVKTTTLNYVKLL